MKPTKKKRAKKGEAGASGPNRSKASFSKTNTHSDKLAAYKYDSKPGVIMNSSASEPSRADKELSRLMKGDVFRSASQTVKQTNSNSRRYR